MDAKQQLTQICKGWDDSIVSNDATEIGKFMSEDWIIVGSDGINTKSQFLASIRSGDLTHSIMNVDETIINIYNETAVVVSRGTSAGKYKGQDFNFYEWSTSVFIRQSTNWICVHTMLTPAQKRSEAPT